MKNLSFLLFLFIPFFGSAQSLNGVYTGVLSNDSTTIRRDQSFEMALTEYDGKVYGYAYSTFIVNDTLYYIVKRVKGIIQGDVCEVEDDEVISHNFPQKPEKKVFVSYTLRRNASGNTWTLDGNWKTNATKKYYAISGKVDTKEEKDLSKSKLYEHLGDLDLQKTLVLTKPKEKAPDAKPVTAKEGKTDIAKTDVKTAENKPISNSVITQPGLNEKKDAIVSTNNIADKKSEPVVSKPDIKTTDSKTSVSSNNPLVQNEKKNVPVSDPNAVAKKTENNIAKTDTKLPDNKTVPVTTNNTQVQNVTTDTKTTNKNAIDKVPENSTVKTETKPVENKPITAVVNTQQVQTEKKEVVKSETKTDNKTNVVAVNKPATQDDKKTTIPANTNTIDKKPENSVVKTETKPLESKPVNAVINTQPTQTEKKDVASVNDKKADAYEFQELKRTNRKLKAASSFVDQRASIPSETIFFKSDSLSIALYDNGEVDGDTVSVIINDEMFIEKQGLRSSAFRKTFYVPYDQSDSLLVVLYAENLGKYPPNTGLLQIKDGEEIFYVRFKADLDKNAAIVLRRKYK